MQVRTMKKTEKPSSSSAPAITDFGPLSCTSFHRKQASMRAAPLMITVPRA